MFALTVNADQTLGKRIDRAKAEKERSCQYLEELETHIPSEQLEEWRVKEAEWKENVEHLEQDGDDFESPYELNAQQSMWFSYASMSSLSHVSLGFSPKELLATMAERHHQTGEASASLLSVIERGVQLQEERCVCLWLNAPSHRS